MFLTNVHIGMHFLFSFDKFYIYNWLKIFTHPGYLTKEIHVLPSEHWMPPVDHPYCDVENKDPILISTGCQTDIFFDQMEYMERCINDKDSFIREVFVEKVTKSDSSVRQYTGIPSITLLFGLFNIIFILSLFKVLEWSEQCR